MNYQPIFVQNTGYFLTVTDAARFERVGCKPRNPLSYFPPRCHDRGCGWSGPFFLSVNPVKFVNFRGIKIVQGKGSWIPS
jgi:hypothetical protein